MKESKIPYSREAETYVLGSILVEPELANEFCGRLSVDDFYVTQNKQVYQAIEALYLQNKEVTILNVIETLKSQGTYESTGEPYLFELADSIPSIITTGTYVDVLKDKSLERELFYETREIGQKVLEGTHDISELLAESEKKIMTIVNKQHVENMKTISVAMDDVFDIIEKNRQNSVNSLIGLDTGFEGLNNFTYGFQPGELIILAARPGVGKSALALSIAMRMCTNVQAHVAFFALEMGTDQLVMRLLSMASNVPLANIRNGNMTEVEATKLLGGRITLDSMNLYIDETTTSNIEDIKLQCRKLKREKKLDCIIIDYLQLLSVYKGNKASGSRYEEVTILSRSLKLLARELEVPILALSQLSRNAEVRAVKEGKKPILSDLRESGSIEQDADIVLFLHAEKEKSKEVSLIVAKNRQGMTGEIPLIFRSEYTSFESMEKK